MSADITEERIAEIRMLANHLRADGKIVGAMLCDLLDALLSARSQLAALQSVPQGAEVPELDPGANPHQRNIENPGSFGWTLNRAFRDGYNEARKNARLVPTPPQAAPEQAFRLIDIQGQLPMRSVGLRGIQLPIQPEERRVGPDEVVVPRSAAEYAIRAFDWIECPDSEHYEAWRAFLDALRAPAQDPGQRGEG